MCLVRDIGCKRIVKRWCQLCYLLLEMSLNPQDQKNKGQKSDLLKLWAQAELLWGLHVPVSRKRKWRLYCQLAWKSVSCGILRTGSLRTSQRSVLGMNIVDSRSESLQQWDSFNQIPGQWWRHLNGGGEGGKHRMRFHDRLASGHRWSSLWWLIETNTLSKFIVWE